jgi:hypothetical protein
MNYTPKGRRLAGLMIMMMIMTKMNYLRKFIFLFANSRITNFEYRPALTLEGMWFIEMLL